MVIRCFQQVADGESMKMRHSWKPLDDISRSLPVAVMASEDQRFLLHHGFAEHMAAKEIRYSLHKKLLTF